MEAVELCDVLIQFIWGGAGKMVGFKISPVDSNTVQGGETSVENSG